MSKYNFNYAKIKEEDNTLEYAPLPLRINGENVWTNIPEKYIDCGYYPIEYTEIPQKENFYYTGYWAIENNKCIQQWEEHAEVLPEEMVLEEEVSNNQE